VPGIVTVMNWRVALLGETKIHTKFWLGNLVQTICMKDLDMNGRTKTDLREIVWKMLSVFKWFSTGFSGGDFMERVLNLRVQ
jgi:hypothetical protein